MAEKTSSTPRNGASCRGCDRRWTGPRECHCSGCHRHFSSLYTFDAHRKNGRCLDPSRVRVKGRKLKAVTRASGQVWVLDLGDVDWEEAA